MTQKRYQRYHLFIPHTLLPFFKTWRLQYPQQNNRATEAIYWTTCSFLWSSKRLYTTFFTYAVMVPKSKLVELPFKSSTWVNVCPTTGLGWVLTRFQAVFRLMRFLCYGPLSSLSALLPLTHYPSVMIDTEWVQDYEYWKAIAYYCMKQQYNGMFPIVFGILCVVPNLKYTINCLYLDIWGGTEATEMEKKGNHSVSTSYSP